jgi:hypothetical protein
MIEYGIKFFSSKRGFVKHPLADFVETSRTILESTNHTQSL